MSDRKRVVTYARQSISKLPEESLSIDFQQAACREYAARQGWAVVGEYSDPDTKGWKRNRPGFDAMLAAVDGGTADTVVIYKLSRFARNLMMQEEVVTAIADAGGELVSVTEPHVSTSPMVRQILGAVNEQYRRDQGDWLRSTWAARARRGFHHGYAPIGYRIADKRLVLDEATAPLVRDVFDWALAGHGTIEITFRLNERGIVPPRASIWTPSAAQRMLRNPVYAGHVLHNGEIVARDAHPAIVTDAEFAAVQDQLGRRAYQRRKASPSWAEGFVYHACGERMYLAGWMRDGTPDPRFRCHRAFARSERGVFGCTHRPASVFARFVEAEIVADLETMIDRIAPPDAVLAELRAQQGATAARADRHRAALVRRLDDLKRQQQRLVDLVIQEVIEPGLYREKDDALKAEIASVTDDLAAVPAPVQPAEVHATHGRLVSLVTDIRAVAAIMPAALVDVLGALDARLIVGSGPLRLEVGTRFRAYVR